MVNKAERHAKNVDLTPIFIYPCLKSWTMPPRESQEIPGGNRLETGEAFVAQCKAKFSLILKMFLEAGLVKSGSILRPRPAG
jgi:hypothetical protein